MRPGVVLVVGATGSVGIPVVAEALAQGYRVRALVRDRGRVALLPAGAEVVVGDITSTGSLGPAVNGVDPVVFAHGSHGARGEAEAVDYGAVRNILTALGGRRVRIALMTTIGVTDRATEGHDWKRRGERLVRASGAAYTIVRPGWFDYNEPSQRRIVMRQDDTRSTASPTDGVIARDQLARVLVDSLDSDAADHKTFELVAEEGSEQHDLSSTFGSLERDTGIDGVRDSDNMPLTNEPDGVTSDLERITL